MCRTGSQSQAGSLASGLTGLVRNRRQNISTMPLDKLLNKFLYLYLFLFLFCFFSQFQFRICFYANLCWNWFDNDQLGAYITYDLQLGHVFLPPQELGVFWTHCGHHVVEVHAHMHKVVQQIGERRIAACIRSAWTKCLRGKELDELIEQTYLRGTWQAPKSPGESQSDDRHAARWSVRTSCAAQRTQCPQIQLAWTGSKCSTGWASVGKRRRRIKQYRKEV